MAYSLEEGSTLVKAARHSVELFLTSVKFKKSIVEKRAAHLEEHHGIFVNIRHYPLGAPRGSAALIKGVRPVRSLIVDAAILAASEDKRHVPVSHHELEHILFEVGVFSRPVRLSGPISKMKLRQGKEGIMVEYGFRSGFLLPEEIKKGEKMERILEKVCAAAGISSHDYKRADVSFHKFSAQRFVEIEPSGQVEEVG
ncbi:MAG: TIGR00296 family protein [Candidatus Micrarchaeota archaeon]|nr:TIGR00296 family protein [Candidatus Micrarchaeota archaeon]